MVILLSVLHLGFIFFLAKRCWKKENTLRKFFWPALAFKLFAGVLLGLVYIYYYPTADTFGYFRDAAVLADLARTSFRAWLDVIFSSRLPSDVSLTFDQSRALFLTKITSVFNLLTADQYWMISAWYSALSFWGAWSLVRAIHRHMPSVTMPAVVAFLYLPSAVFWTSGLLKESLAVGAMSFLAALFLKVWFRERIPLLQGLLAILSLWIFWNLKYYYAAVFLPVVIATLLYRAFFSRRRTFTAGIEALLWLGLLVLPAMAITFLHPNFYPHRIFQVVLANNAAYNALSQPGGVVHFHNLRPAMSSFIENAPWALFSGLFRPLLGENFTLMPLLASVENSVVLVLFMLTLSRWREYAGAPNRILIFALGSYVALLCILLTFSAPNFGTLSRYRSGYFSFFVFLVLCGNPLMRYVQRTVRWLDSQHGAI